MSYFDKENFVNYPQGGIAGVAQTGAAAPGLYSNQQLGYASTPTTQPKDRRLESCIKRFDQLLDSYADLAQQTEMLATSIAGPTPQPPDSNQATPQPVALIGQLEYLTDQFAGRAQRIQSALRRLQEL